MWPPIKFTTLYAFFKKKLERIASVTPAMAAGVTDHVWSIEELLNFRLFST
jgi:hypothetical protein